MSYTKAYCRECDWKQVFTQEDNYQKAKHAAKVHIHSDAHIREVEE